MMVAPFFPIFPTEKNGYHAMVLIRGLFPDLPSMQSPFPTYCPTSHSLTPKHICYRYMSSFSLLLTLTRAPSTAGSTQFALSSLSRFRSSISSTMACTASGVGYTAVPVRLALAVEDKEGNSAV
jgi:hypothetical protein